MKKPKHELSRTFDCLNCYRLKGIGETYFAKGDGPYFCDVCKSELVKRVEDSEPFEGIEVVGDELATGYTDN